jgi:signal transduction histidine kinase
MMSMSSPPDTHLADLARPRPGPSRAEELVRVVQEVSAARTLERIQEIVRSAARRLTGADGATIVLRDGDQCHYADEDAIAPLWKGKRFPMRTCVSGWAMIHRQGVVIPDVYQDERIPITVYRATFVRSLAMMPIRTADPLGAIGVYWAAEHFASEEEVQLLAALANSTAVAIENVRLTNQLTARIDELQRLNHELERFTWVSFHDFQEPLRMIATHADLIERSSGDKLSPTHRRSLSHVREGERRLRRLTSGLAEYVDLRDRVQADGALDVVPVVQQALAELAAELSTSEADVRVGALPQPVTSALHLRRLFVHLIGNALKFRRPGVAPLVLISGAETESEWLFRVEDNGIGIDPAHQDQVFGFFERLNPQDQYPGSGLGLTICRKILENLGGRISVDSDPARGSAFHFSLPRPLIADVAPEPARPAPRDRARELGREGDGAQRAAAGS